MTTVDVHAHAHFLELDPLVSNTKGLLDEQATAPSKFGQASLDLNQRLFKESWCHSLTDPTARKLAMNEGGIDVQIVSVSPLQYHYWADRKLAADITKVTNLGIAKTVATNPKHLFGLATVSLQHPDLMVSQLEYAVRELGMVGVEIGTHAGGRDFSSPDFEPFWAAADALGVAIFIHPWGCTLDDRLQNYYLGNVIGNPVETSVALSHIIFSGILDRHPTLRICAAHGGGYLPHYISRSNHAYDVRPESKTMKERPSEYLKKMWFDSLVFDQQTLRALISAVGANRVVIGSDYPFDMGVTNTVSRLLELTELSEQDKNAISGSNAIELFRLPV